MTAPDRGLESPCVDICCLDGAGKLCVGCFRTIEEITSWATLPDDARHRVRVLAEERRTAESLRGR
ncbi:MAG TPA: DUF1289 domain-containing protein [Alphaproteobacteria bacterium]|nr:DUF1289 domain-containing protein [Alphaproteobacteria bacterium]